MHLAKRRIDDHASFSRCQASDSKRDETLRRLSDIEQPAFRIEHRAAGSFRERGMTA